MPRPPNPNQTGKKAQDVYDFVLRWTIENGNFPTYRTIAAHLGISSTFMVAYYLRILLKDGRLEHFDGQHLRFAGYRWTPIEPVKFWGTLSGIKNGNSLYSLRQIRALFLAPDA